MTTPRIILYTGKGGVGTTTLAAATALRCAERGLRTVVLSTDTAHSLADSFDTTLGPEPAEIAPNLWGQETDIYFNLKSWWGTVQEWLTALIMWRGVDEVIAEEIAVLPGMEELSNLLWINRHYEEGKYDVIIVDCAPTSETLKLLSFPEVARWWVDHILPIERQLANVVRPMLRRITDMPLPGDEIYDTAERLFHHLDQLHQLLTQPNATVRLVVNPEKMVIKEAQRTFTYLNLYGYATDAIICNRILPTAVHDEYFTAWHLAQDKYRQVIEESFSPLPILKVPLLDQEVVGEDMLRRLGDAVFGDQDPSLILFEGRPHAIEREDSAFILHIPLPFVDKSDISLVRHSDELIVQAGKHRRNIILPHALVTLPTGNAKFEGDVLKVRFPVEHKTYTKKK